MGITTKEWYDIPSPGLMFFQTSPQEVLQMEPIRYKSQEMFSRNKVNNNIMCVRDTILAPAEESSIDEHLLLIDNQSICNAFANGKYLWNIRDDPYRQYLRAHCNSGVTYTNKICDLPRYYNPICYKPKGIDNILSIGSVQKYYLGTYNNQYGNEIVVHIPQQPTFKMTKAGLFYHDMIHLLKNKIMLTSWWIIHFPPPHKYKKIINITPTLM